MSTGELLERAHGAEEREVLWRRRALDAQGDLGRARWAVWALAAGCLMLSLALMVGPACAHEGHAYETRMERDEHERWHVKQVQRERRRERDAYVMRQLDASARAAGFEDHADRLAFGGKVFQMLLEQALLNKGHQP